MSVTLNLTLTLHYIRDFPVYSGSLNSLKFFKFGIRTALQCIEIQTYATDALSHHHQSPWLDIH